MTFPLSARSRPAIRQLAEDWQGTLSLDEIGWQELNSELLTSSPHLVEPLKRFNDQLLAVSQRLGQSDDLLAFGAVDILLPFAAGALKSSDNSLSKVLYKSILRYSFQDGQRQLRVVVAKGFITPVQGDRIFKRLTQLQEQAWGALGLIEAGVWLPLSLLARASQLYDLLPQITLKSEKERLGAQIRESINLLRISLRQPNELILAEQRQLVIEAEASFSTLLGTGLSRQISLVSSAERHWSLLPSFVARAHPNVINIEKRPWMILWQSDWQASQGFGWAFGISSLAIDRPTSTALTNLEEGIFSASFLTAMMLQAASKADHLVAFYLQEGAARVLSHHLIERSQGKSETAPGLPWEDKGEKTTWSLLAQLIASQHQDYIEGLIGLVTKPNLIKQSRLDEVAKQAFDWPKEALTESQEKSLQKSLQTVANSLF